MTGRALLLAQVFALLVSGAVRAEDSSKSIEPYIDQVRKEIQNKEGTGGQPGSETPFIDSVKKRMGEAGEPTTEKEGSYIEALKKEDPGRYRPATGSFIGKVKAGLAPKETGGAIEAVREGHSELEMKRPGEIHNAAGFKLGSGSMGNYQVTAGPSGTGVSFDSLYGGNWVPDFSFFYEYQPFHSEWLGNIGIFASTGLGIFHGTGSFKFQPPCPTSPVGICSGFFSPTSGTTFRFFSIPTFVGLDYRFNLFRIVRPFVQAGAGAIGYAEYRSDNLPTHQGYSTSYMTSFGANLLLDWLSRSTSWDLYRDYGFKHYYLSLDYTLVRTLNGDVNFASSGFNLGLVFEF